MAAIWTLESFENQLLLCAKLQSSFNHISQLAPAEAHVAEQAADVSVLSRNNHSQRVVSELSDFLRQLCNCSIPF